MMKMSRDSAVGIATGYGLDRSEFESRWGQEFSLLHVVQRVKRAGREVNHSPPTIAEIKKMWIYTSTPPYAFMA
jgi:hypothetical protein